MDFSKWAVFSILIELSGNDLIFYTVSVTGALCLQLKNDAIIENLQCPTKTIGEDVLFCTIHTEVHCQPIWLSL